MMNSRKLITTLLLMVAAFTTSHSASAAISLDRTRIVFSGQEKSTSLGVANENKQYPYLAQSWLEDEQGRRVNSPLTALPPLQRIEPGARGQVKIQALDNIAQALPQDRESLFYFNLREIPPVSDKPNTLQIALQTRIKMFYRPAALASGAEEGVWQKNLTLTKQGDRYEISNPSPYYVTVVDVARGLKSASVKEFMPLMIEPFGKKPLTVGVAAAGSSPVLTLIDDYGARPQAQFTCSGSTCRVSSVSR